MLALGNSSEGGGGQRGLVAASQSMAQFPSAERAHRAPLCSTHSQYEQREQRTQDALSSSRSEGLVAAAAGKDAVEEVGVPSEEDDQYWPTN